MPTQINHIINLYHGADKWHTQYPWFATGRLIEAALQEGKPELQEVKQRTVIFFNDVHRFHWLLQEKNLDQQAVLAEYDLSEQAGDGVTIEKIINVETVIEPEILPGATVTAIRETTDAENLPEILQDAPGIIETSPQLNVGESFGEPAKSGPLLPIPEVLPVPEFEKEIREEEQEERLMAVEPPAAMTDEAEPDGDELETEQENESAVPLFTSGVLSASLAEASRSFKEEPVTDQPLIIASEPYHTIDYFASQGIRLEIEPKADDKFGQQLKSFTSWLKQMKRLPSTKMGEKEPDPEIEDIASHSLEAGEVVTESMADVLIKQGKTGQAVDVLKKLSLLHPEKSHYFATLIEKITL